MSIEQVVDKPDSKLGDAALFDFGFGSPLYACWRTMNPDFFFPLNPLHFFKRLTHEELHLLGDNLTGVIKNGPIQFADNFYWLYSRTLEKIWPDSFVSSESLYSETGRFASVPDPKLPLTGFQDIVEKGMPYLIMPVIGNMIIEYGNHIKGKPLRLIVKGFGYSVAFDPILNNLLTFNYKDTDLYKMAEPALNAVQSAIGHPITDISPELFYLGGLALGIGAFYLGKFAAEKIKEGIADLSLRDLLPDPGSIRLNTTY
jgi:hypothetical protein